MARDGERGRGDWKARLGSRNSGPYADASEDTGPIDIAAVRRDDALIEAIASDGPVRTDSAEEYQLAALLADWRAELVSPPMPAAPDLDAVVAAVNQEIGARQVRHEAHSGSSPRRLRLVRPLLGAAAALALIFGGVTAFSYGSEPGDPLWKVKEVVFSQAAQSTVAQRADTDLDEAGKLITQNPAQAKNRLEQARVNAEQVDNPERHDKLMSEWKRLVAQLRDMGYGDLADQLDQGTSTKPTDPSSSTTTKPAPSGNETAVPPVQQTKPGQPSDKPTEPTEPSTPTTDEKPNPPTVTTPPPTAEPTTQPPVTPTTISKPTVVEPTADNGGAPSVPPRVPTQGSPATTFVIPSGGGAATPS
ncbi:anti-sigma-D factor RsdA-like protein [Nocardia tenerifensis]|uniref:Anti-sigma-D factor RsdA-like protein n=1 Tax=Nocardia tenerifensis TaxID=228006 RepID=A0A318K371_9NOCA|nr:anti-sigma-D factor RsdA [Nocardia tenerifensis]PXX66494.1 anti-sigma-D factor RsdA-like protein [Nocardia tenerifensis]